MKLRYMILTAAAKVAVTGTIIMTMVVQMAL